MSDKPVMMITGTRKGIGFYLANYYLDKNYCVIGCSRKSTEIENTNYEHFLVDVSDEQQVGEMFAKVRKKYGRLDILINNAGIASMNHFLLTPMDTARKLMNTNFIGTFLMCREAAKIMQKNHFGRIVNFTTVAKPLKLAGEAAYVASKSAIESLTCVLAHELADFGITVNAIGPAPIKTELIASVPEEKIERLLSLQAIHRFGEFRDISNVIDFFIKPESDFITGQVIYLGGVS